MFENLIILGSAPGEMYGSPPGDIRAYDVITGEKKWQFHTVPLPGEFGYNSWPEEAFKYVGGVSNVIAFMPPALGSPPQYAIYLQKSDLSQQLKVPLVRTLSPKVPLPTAINPGEINVRGRETSNGTDSYAATTVPSAEVRLSSPVLSISYG